MRGAMPGSVRALQRKLQINSEAPQRLPASRLVPTRHSINRKMLMEMLRERVVDGSLLRLIGKCLHVGALDGEEY
ncbi:MAG TPA: hypothetical protein VMK12_07880, partial [Anaeromyxobacteraceae bacterium]|nr:hypothetical protein [Anaeromyxobacteraceae bacterium]